MKQVLVRHTKSPKQAQIVKEPCVKAISRIGAHEANVAPLGGLYKKTGVEAPTHKTTSHPTGTQGKHK